MASKINADEFVDREGEGKPTLPKGVVLSGVTTITTAVVAENEVANSTGINAGIITSTHFKGNLTGDVNAGIVTVTSQTVVGSAVTISASGIDIGAGVITATSYAGGGGNLTGIGATIMVWEYNPDPYDTIVGTDTGIGITFNQKIKAGSGNITLSIANAGVAGTVVENFGVGSSVTIFGNSATINPTADLLGGFAQYFISYPSGCFTNMAGEDYVGTGYTFGTRVYTKEVYVAGDNDCGGLGQNNVTDYSSPVQIPGTTWESGSGSYQNTGLIKTDGTLWMIGKNQHGQIGLNDRGPGNSTARSSPVQVPGTTWSKVSGGHSHMLALKTDGTIWSWGYNAQGQLGNNTNAQRSSPVQIPGTTWSDICADSKNSYGIKTDGSLWSWGKASSGELGNNNKTQRSSPIQVGSSGAPSSFTWASIYGVFESAHGIKTDGTLWSWGYNGQGQLGQNNKTNYSSPKQIPGTTWSKVRGGESSAFAIKTDGTLWAWGNNSNYGQLGVNNKTDYSSPIQIPGTTWSDVAMDWIMTSYAIKTDGTLWGWGRNQHGDIGSNNTTKYSSPVQIGSDTDWNWISSRGYSGCLRGKRI